MSDIAALSPAKRALLERALKRRREAAGAAGEAIPRRTDRGPAPLSYSQQRMWFLQQWEPQAPTFNGARATRLRGPLDRDALEHALASIVGRHESLRTVVRGSPEPRQVVLSSWSLKLGVVALTEPDPQESMLRDLLRELSREPFDLAEDLMLRATLIERSAHEHVLLIRMHHIAADAHSDSVLYDELSEIYNARVQGRAPRLPELPIQYSDFAVWERERLRGALLDELRSYWARQLEGAPPLLRLPTVRKRPVVQRHGGAHHALELPRSLVGPLLALGREEGLTFFMTMLATFATLLYRISGESDIVIGSPIANRNRLELQGLIGFFTNTLALRTRLDGNPTFREAMRRARETALGAYAHQDLPFEKVVEAVQPKRDPSYNPLFQVNFRAQATERPGPALAGLQAEPLPVDIGFSRFDLALELVLGADSLHGYLEYDRDLFDLDTISALEQDLEALLAAAGADPDAPILAVSLPHGRPTAQQTTRVIRRRLPK